MARRGHIDCRVRSVSVSAETCIVRYKRRECHEPKTSFLIRNTCPTDAVAGAGSGRGQTMAGPPCRGHRRIGRRRARAAGACGRGALEPGAGRARERVPARTGIGRRRQRGRQDAFASSSAHYFPLSGADRANLLRMYPAGWKGQ
jgi:hypothetical protein